MALLHKRQENRVFLLDEIRGFAILCMVVYHAFYDLVFLFGVDIPFFYSLTMNTIRDLFAGAFVFISGSVCLYSHSNTRRGVLCFLLGVLLTVVTAFVGEDTLIRFGILHLLGCCMLLYAAGAPLVEKVSVRVGLPLALALFLLTYRLPVGRLGIPYFAELSLPYAPLYRANLYPLGFPAADFFSSDYFPILPWAFLFFAGCFFGRLLKAGRAPRVFYRSHCRLLQAVGRNTIWIYLLHQPILYGVMQLIAALR